MSSNFFKFTLPSSADCERKVMKRLFILFCISFLTISAQDFSKICKLPSERGNCKEALVTWFYDTKAGQCGVFLFSGCNGNANRFTTKAECEKYCAPKMMMIRDNESKAAVSGLIDLPTDHDCSVSKDEGVLCNETDSSIQTGDFRWYWNEDKFYCLSFKFNGCGGNSNNFRSHNACTKRCQPSKRCSLFKSIPLVGLEPYFFKNVFSGLNLISRENEFLRLLL